MGNFTNDIDRCAEQIRRLEKLRCAHFRRAFVEQLERYRQQPKHENQFEQVEESLSYGALRQSEGLERPAVQRAFPTRGELDPVLVVPDEVLVPASQAEQAVAVLRNKFRVKASERRIFQRRLVALEPADGVRLSAAEAVLRLQSAGIRAGANHVSMLSGRDKAGNTPEPTEVELGTGTTSTTGTAVVVIDTGIDQAAANRNDNWLNDVDPVDAHVDYDLLDRVDAQGNMVADGLLDLGAGHGTFVAGIVRQISPNANVRMIRALDTDGIGSEVMIADAILRAADEFQDGRGVLNLSLGMETLDGQEPVGLRLALDALPPEVLVVAAAGNAASGIPLWPAASKRVLAVASHQGDAERTPSTWSNYGSWVDFSARGECVVSTFVNGTETPPAGPWDLLRDPDPDTFDEDNQLAVWTGTSFAAPQVAGLLANMLEADSDLTRAAAQTELQDPSISMFSASHGYRLDIL